MTIFCYARVSAADQNPEMQENALTKKFPDGILRTEKASGVNSNRPVLNLILNMAGAGDKLVVWKLDRLARDVRNLLKIVDELEMKGTSLVIMDQSIDTETASGMAFLQMLGVFAEFETNLRRERQMTGIARARALGRRLGRRPSLTDDQKIRLRSDASCTTISELAIRYRVSRGTVYNCLNEG